MSLQRIVLDTSALIQHPELLAYAGKNKLVIPKAVLDELSARGRLEARNGIADLVHQASNRGAMIVAPVSDQLENDLLASDRYAQSLSGADIDIARLAIDYSNHFGPDSVLVVTLDRALQRFLSTRQIKSATAAQFVERVAAEKPDPEIQQSARKFSNRQFRFATLSVSLGLISSLVGNLLFSHISYLVNTVSIWGTIIVLPLLGIALFWYRQRFRLSYGVFEFAVGVIMTYYVFFPAFSYTTLSAVEGIQIVGGLYVMVRGLDNVGKGVEGTRAESFWKKWFE